MTFDELYDIISSGNGKYSTHIIYDKNLDLFFPDFSDNKSCKNYNFRIICDSHEHYKIILKEILQYGGKFILRNVFDAYLCDAEKITKIYVDDSTYNLDLSFDMENYIKFKSLTIENFIENYTNHTLVTRFNDKLSVPYKDNFDRVQCTVDKFTSYLKIFDNLNMDLKLYIINLYSGNGESTFFTLSNGIMIETSKLNTELLNVYTNDQINEFNIMSNI